MISNLQLLAFFCLLIAAKMVEKNKELKIQIYFPSNNMFSNLKIYKVSSIRLPWLPLNCGGGGATAGSSRGGGDAAGL